MFEGWWRDEVATRAVTATDGWLQPAISEWRDERLRLIDRARHFLVTTGGKTSPSTIENLMRASPFVSEAIVYGHGRKHLTALIEIEYDAVADWAHPQYRLYRIREPHYQRPW